ncbi:MAG: hypothetical protein Q7T90_11625, partial [Thiobacillus sp.]|nr:hypothetical protein [Thiobacillus sp.]
MTRLVLAALASCATLVHGGGSTVVFNAPASVDLAAGGVGDRIAVGDFDRDGNLDMVTTPDLSAPESYPNVDGVSLLFGDGQGGFPQTSSVLAGEYLTGIATADF